MTHQISKPQFAYSDLEPYIDSQTMEIHTEKHHRGYADKLNAALANEPALQSKTLEEILKDTRNLSPAVINPAGGVWNHNFFWSILSPKIDQPLPQPLLNSLNASFDNLESFKTQFTAKASSLFGSGWTWLVKKDNSLDIINLQNQDNPLSKGMIPLLAIDLWEHAYYLRYQNRRPEYIEAFWHIINWEQVSQLLLNNNT